MAPPRKPLQDLSNELTCAALGYATDVIEQLIIEDEEMGTMELLNKFRDLHTDAAIALGHP